MKLTPYGSIAAAALLVGSSLFQLNFKLFLIIVSSVLIQSQLCEHCDKSFNMVAFMAVFPLLSLFLSKCEDTYKIILGFSIIAGVSRIGCYFAGCCTGKETDKDNLSIEYSGNYVVNKNTHKHTVYVKPTIFLEIFLQLLFVFIIIKSRNPLVLFGVLNAILIILTDYWRLGRRGANTKIVAIAAMSLATFSLIARFKCKNLIKPKLTFSISIYKIIFAILVALILSNDLNFDSFKKKKDNQK